jgi:hypothetical protein
MRGARLHQAAEAHPSGVAAKRGQRSALQSVNVQTEG